MIIATNKGLETFEYSVEVFSYLAAKHNVDVSMVHYDTDNKIFTIKDEIVATVM